MAERDELELRRLARQLDMHSPHAAGLVRQVDAFESAVADAARRLAELSAGVAPDVWLHALGRELWAQAELRNEKNIDGLFVTAKGEVWARPKGSRQTPESGREG